MKWSFSGDAPIYTQLMTQLTMGIVSGEFPSGERLPSVRELASEAGVNPNTMQRALSEMERAGLVCSQRTAGRFVTEDTQVIDRAKGALAASHIQRFVSAMEGLGYNTEEIIALLRQGAGKEEN